MSNTRTAKPKAQVAEITSAASWKDRASQGMPVTLPSGNTARLRRTLDLPDLLSKGKIPNPLAPVIQDMLQQQKASIQIAGNENADVLMAQMMELVDSQIPRIFVEPRVEVRPDDWDDEAQGEWEPSDDAITLSDIDIEDRMHAFAFAQGGPADAATFRQESKAAVARMADEPKVPVPSKRSRGPRK